MSDIESRMLQLERQNRLMRTAILGTYCMLGLAVVMGATVRNADVADEIRTKRLVIEDEDGNERIAMEVKNKRLSEQRKDKRKGDFAEIAILDSEGDQRIVLDASDGGLSRCLVYSEDGDRRFELLTSVDDFAKFLHYDAKGRNVESRWP